MAKGGFVVEKVTAYNTLRFGWTLASQNVTENYSIIDWELVLTASEYGAISSSVNKMAIITIDGVRYTYDNINIKISNSTEKVLVSGSAKIEHYGNGTKQFSFGFVQQFAITFAGAYIGDISGGGTGVLDAIERPAYFTNTPNFTDEENPTVGYSNPMGANVSKVEVCISSDGYKIEVPYKEVSKTGTSYSFVLSENELKELRALVTRGYSATVKFYIKTTFLSGNSIISTRDVKNTFTIVNGRPTLEATVTDSNSFTLALTGDSNILIKGKSYASWKITAEGKKDATITSYYCKNGSDVYDTSSGVVTSVTTGTFLFVVHDNRNNSTRLSVTKRLINYFNPSCRIEIIPPDVNDDSLRATIKGSFFNGSFGRETNAIARLQYRYKRGSGNFTEWYTLNNITIADDGTYSAELTISDTDYQEQYVIQASISDKLTTINSPEESILIKPIFDWGKNDFNFNVPVSIMGDTINDFVIETGTEAMGTNGTWYWRKWQSGRADCYGRRNYGNVNINTAWGSMYESETFKQSYPVGLFAAAPEYCDIELMTTTSGVALVAQGFEGHTKDETAGFALVRPGTYIVGQATLGFNVIGRWK